MNDLNISLTAMSVFVKLWLKVTQIYMLYSLPCIIVVGPIGWLYVICRYLFQLTASFVSKFLLLFFFLFMFFFFFVIYSSDYFFKSIRAPINLCLRGTFQKLFSLSYSRCIPYFYTSLYLPICLKRQGANIFFFLLFFRKLHFFLTVNLSIVQNRFIRSGQLVGKGKGFVFILATINCNLTGASDSSIIWK